MSVGKEMISNEMHWIMYLLKFFEIDFTKRKYTWFKRGAYDFELSRLLDSLSDWIADNKLEIYSAIAYLMKEEKLPNEEIIRRMKLVKPWFSDKEVIDAIKLLLDLQEEIIDKKEE